jgi:hypothetical protein
MSIFNISLQGEQKKYLNGQTPYMSSLEDIGVKAGIELAEFRWPYVFLSGHVHDLPLSLYRMGLREGDGRGRGLPEDGASPRYLPRSCALNRCGAPIQGVNETEFVRSESRHQIQLLQFARRKSDIRVCAN